MRIIKITENSDGSHDNLSPNSPVAIPPDWAVIPDDMSVPDSFPLVDIEVESGIVTSIIAKELPPEPTPNPPTPAELREYAYNTEPIIPWDGDMITVTEAALKWQYYAAEGSSRADELTELIAAAKAEIRERYPDEEV